MFKQVELAFDALVWGIKAFFKNFLEFFYFSLFIGLFAWLVIFITSWLGDLVITDIWQTKLDEQIVQCIQGACPRFMVLYDTMKNVAASQTSIFILFAIVSLIAFIFGVVINLGFVKMGLQIFDQGKTSYQTALAPNDKQIFRAALWFAGIIGFSQFENVVQGDMTSAPYIIGFFIVLILLARFYFYLPYVADKPKMGVIEALRKSVASSGSCWIALILVLLVSRAVFGWSDSYITMKYARLAVFMLWPIVPLAFVYLYRIQEKKPKKQA